MNMKILNTLVILLSLHLHVSESCEIEFATHVNYEGKKDQDILRMPGTENHKRELLKVTRVYFCGNDDSKKIYLKFGSLSFSCNLEGLTGSGNKIESFSGSSIRKVSISGLNELIDENGDVTYMKRSIRWIS